jgi:regulatory protein
VLDTDAGLERALAIAYPYLNSRERTQDEMRAHLRRKGIDPQDVERSIQALTGRGHLDDVRFARLFVQDKRELDGWGGARIRQALRSRGIDAELVQAVLGADDGDSEIERALAVLRRRFPTPARERRERERALGLLLRKGYDPDLAIEAIAAHSPDSDPVE